MAQRAFNFDALADQPVEDLTLRVSPVPLREQKPCTTSQEKQPRTDFYTYRLIRSDLGLPFYIGKGTRERIGDHESNAKNHKDCTHRLCRTIRKLWSEGHHVIREKIAENITEASAFDLEKFFISLGAVYNWPLVNHTYGGEGTVGYRFTDEQRKNLSEAVRRQMIMHPDHFARFQEGRANRIVSPEELKRRNASITRAWSSSTLRQEKSEVSQMLWQDEEFRARQKTGMQRPEVRQKLANANLGRKQPENERVKRAQSLKNAYISNPELRQTKSEMSKKMWQDEEFRARQQAIMDRPEVKAKQREARLGKLPANTKTYSGFLAPDGVTVYENVFNLADFCEKHGLSNSKMCLVAQGKRKSHQGWTLYPPLPEKEPDYYHTGFRSPLGEVFDKIASLSAFCREHGLQHSNMVLVAQGKQDAHKGWTKHNP